MFHPDDGGRKVAGVYFRCSEVVHCSGLRGREWSSHLAPRPAKNVSYFAGFSACYSTIPAFLWGDSMAGRRIHPWLVCTVLYLPQLPSPPAPRKPDEQTCGRTVKAAVTQNDSFWKLMPPMVFCPYSSDTRVFPTIIL